MFDAEGQLQVANERAAALLDLPLELLASRPSFNVIKKYQQQRGEFANAEEAFRLWLNDGSLLSCPACYERERPNGMLLEIRTSSLPDGGVVRTYADVTERKRAEAALHATTALLNATLENMDQGLMMVDGDGIVQVCNEQAIRLLGLPGEMMRMRPSFVDVISYQNGSGEFAGATEARDSWLKLKDDLLGAPAVYERSRPDGTVLEVRTVRLSDGGAVRTFTDLTARKRQQAALAESEALHRLLAENAIDKIGRTSLDGIRLYVSPAARDLVGYEPDQLVGHSLLDLVHPQDLTELEALLAALRAGHLDRAEHTHRVRHADDRWIWCEVRFRLVRDPVSREPKELVTVTRDVTERIKAETALRASDARSRALGDVLPQLVWLISASDGKTLYVNGTFASYYGDIGRSRADRVARNHPDDADRIARAWTTASEAGQTFEVEGRLRRHDGAYRWHKLIMKPVRRNGEIVEWLGTALDIDDVIRDQEALRKTTALVRLAQEGAGAGLFDWNLVTGESLMSVESLRLFGLLSDRESVVVAEEWEQIIDGRDLPVIFAEVDRAARFGAPYRAEFRVRHRDGSKRWVLGVGRLTLDSDGRPERVVGLNMDITERKEAERRAEHQSRHDGLTDLPNRTLFRERLKQSAADAKRRRGSFGLLLLDLDRFKVVNDTLGHQTGDTLLKQVAKRMRSLVRAEDTLARLGGDEFALLLPGRGQVDEVRRVAERLVEAISHPFLIKGQQVSVGVSVGICLAPEDGTDTDTLLKHADLALYRAKGAGRSTFRFYEPSMDAAQQEKQALELDLRRALTRGEFQLHYQPQMDLASGAISGFEALVRWRHPKHGMISPGSFIPLAEETKQIVPLGEWVLREACREAACQPAPMRVAVNVSAVQFRQSRLVQTVMSALAASGLPASRLELEVTETVLIHDAEALQTLHQLRALGVRIALDDFGTGYSSLSYLRRFPFDKIKIDRSFIREIDNEDTAAIVRAMVGLGQRLGMMITAEGVETPEQMDRVRAEGCTEVQGYLISPPAPPHEAFALVREQAELAFAS